MQGDIRIQKRYQVAYNFYGSYKFYGTRLREKHGKPATARLSFQRSHSPIYGSVIPCWLSQARDQKK